MATINIKEQQSSTLSVSRNVLKALTNSLYDSTGINLSPIAKDLANSGLDPDLVNLNLALLMKKPELCDIPEEDKKLRCNYINIPEGSRWGMSMYVYEFKSYSLLHNRVEYVAREFKVYNSENNTHPNEIEVKLIEHSYMDYENWKNLSTDVLPILIDHINDSTETYFKKPE